MALRVSLDRQRSARACVPTLTQTRWYLPACPYPNTSMGMRRYQDRSRQPMHRQGVCQHGGTLHKVCAGDKQ
jgi:hypothetical protein